MDKQTLLAQLQESVTQGQITKQEVLKVFGPNETTSESTRNAPSHFSISDLLYYIGGGIVFAGIAVMVGSAWGILGAVGQLLVTFGGALAAFLVGVLLSKDEDHSGMAQAFFLISGLVMPVGLYVLFDSLGLQASLGVATLISLLLFAIYATTYWRLKKPILAFFAIVFGTGLFINFTDFLVSGNPTIGFNFWLYRILVIGISFTLLGYHLRNHENLRGMSGWLYGFGVIGILGPTLSLGGWKPNQNAFWELIYPILVFATLFMSVWLKNRTFLVWGSIFLMMYIIKITIEYFSEGLGWPLALIVAGLLLIAVGYYSVYLNKRYIAKTTS